MNLDQFSFEQDDRRYINPQTALDESNAFIENLRNVQQQGTEEIAQDTYNLGTQVPSNLGGLVGSEGYFRSRYQTPQTNAIVSDLRAAAQAQALNEAMNNELAIAKQRYNNAYKAAQRRARSRGGGVPAPTTTTPEGEVDYTKSDLPGEKAKPNVSDYISDGTQFGSLGNLFGYSKKYPMSVDGPIQSTDYYTYTSNIKDPQAKSDAWVNYLSSIGYGG